MTNLEHLLLPHTGQRHLVAVALNHHATMDM